MEADAAGLLPLSKGQTRPSVCWPSKRRGAPQSPVGGPAASLPASKTASGWDIARGAKTGRMSVTWRPSLLRLAAAACVQQASE
jgi:hypothetical protein